MRIPLHIKTTILASVAIIIGTAATILIFGLLVRGRIQDEQRDYAEAQAENLAERIADVLPLEDNELVVGRVRIFDAARMKRTKNDKIRIWDVHGAEFMKRIETGDDVSASAITPDIRFALLNRAEVKINDPGEGIYSVFVPVIAGGNVVGAVEFVEELDSLSTLLARYWLAGVSLAFVFISVSAVAIYLLIRFFVHRPLNKIASIIDQFKAGKVEARISVRGRDEFGLLGEELDLMLDKIDASIQERQKQTEVLAEKVKEATAELKRRNEQLERANKEIWQTTSRLSQFEKLAVAGQTAAEFAHEVGTPLNLISGHVQLLKRNPDAGEAVKERLEIIGSQIARIEGIVHSMLDKARFGEVKSEPLDINVVIEGVVPIIVPKLEADNIRLTLDLTENLPPVGSNVQHLQQVFLNLTNNAADAMPDGGELSIRTGEQKGFVVVEVTDSGIGMDEETQKHIFEPLFTTKERGHGTGLGLVVVKQLLGEHNARITIESKTGEGTTIRMLFPTPRSVEDV